MLPFGLRKLSSDLGNVGGHFIAYSVDEIRKYTNTLRIQGLSLSWQWTQKSHDFPLLLFLADLQKGEKTLFHPKLCT